MEGSNRIDSFVLEILGLLPDVAMTFMSFVIGIGIASFVAMTGLGFLLWVVGDFGIASFVAMTGIRIKFKHE